MRGLIGDRFMRRFAGNLKRRWMPATSKPKDQDPEAEGDTVFGPDNSIAEQGIEMGAEDGKYEPDVEEQNAKNESVTQIH